MADQMLNGDAPNGADVVMKEEVAAPEASMDSIQQADPTDPQPPPQPASIAPTQSIPAIPPPSAPTPPAVSGAAGQRPSSMPPQPYKLPQKPVAHGGPTRQYLNMNVTPHLLEGMKHLAANEPEKPLQWLSEFLAERSKAVES